MKQERVDRLIDILPDFDELDPVFDHILATSRPDPGRTWSASGEVGTVGARLVDTESLEAATDEMAERAREHLAGLYRNVARVARALERGEREAAARILVEIAELEEDADRVDRAEAYALAAVEVARELRDRRPVALALRRAGRAARARGRLESALERYREAWEIGRVVGPVRDAAEAAIGAGNVLEQQGGWKEAEAWYRRALDRMDDYEHPAPERWHAALNIHICLRSRGELETSVAWLEQAEEAARKAQDSAAIPYLGSARGQLRIAEGDAHGAERWYRRALAQTDHAVARVTIRLNPAECLLAQGRILEAAEAAREAETESLRAGVVSRLPEAYRLLGRIAAENGNASAFVLFERALRIVREQELPALEEAVTLQAYGDAEKRRGESDTAELLLREAMDIYEELGIGHPRHPWVDLYGSPPEDADGGERDRGELDDG